jgi:exopolysaccharide biosynthesis glucuronosyltransferase PssE
VEETRNVLSQGRLRGYGLLIFVTVGNTRQGFDRLMKAVEGLKAAGLIEGEVLVQYGHSSHVPGNCTCVPFLDREEYRTAVEKASLVISHAGAGAIGACLQAGKKPVIVPREKAYGEHVNDHQIEIAKELGSAGRIYAVFEIEDLPSVVRSALQCGTGQSVSTAELRICGIVSAYLDGIILSKRTA